MSGRARSIPVRSSFLIDRSSVLSRPDVPRAGSIETAMHQRMASSTQRDQLQTTTRCGKPLQMNRCDLGNSMLRFLSSMYRPYVLQLFL